MSSGNWGDIPMEEVKKMIMLQGRFTKMLNQVMAVVFVAAVTYQKLTSSKQYSCGGEEERPASFNSSSAVPRLAISMI